MYSIFHFRNFKNFVLIFWKNWNILQEFLIPPYLYFVGGNFKSAKSEILFRYFEKIVNQQKNSKTFWKIPEKYPKKFFGVFWLEKNFFISIFRTPKRCMFLMFFLHGCRILPCWHNTIVICVVSACYSCCGYGYITACQYKQGKQTHTGGAIPQSKPH